MIDVTTTKVAWMQADAWGEVTYGVAHRYSDGSVTDVGVLDHGAIEPHVALAMFLDGGMLNVDRGITPVTNDDESDALWSSRVATVRLGDGSDLEIVVKDGSAWRQIIGKVVGA